MISTDAEVYILWSSSVSYPTLNSIHVSDAASTTRVTGLNRYQNFDIIVLKSQACSIDLQGNYLTWQRNR